jgi:hypothetical protein
MKKLLITNLFVLTFSVAFAQGDSTSTPKQRKVKHNFQAGFNLNQSTFSDNWTSGGFNSYAFGGFTNYVAKFKTKNWDFTSDLQIQLGFQEIQNEGRRKNADRLFYDFKAGYMINKKWNFFASMNFLSQFIEGYDHKTKSALEPSKDSLISALFAPAYLTSSIGLEYKPLEYLWMRFGAGTLRQTIVLDERISNAGLYGLKKPGDKLRNQAVLQFIANFDKNLAQNVNLKLRYMSNFDYIKATEIGGGMDNSIVHIFNANLTLKATKYISTNLQINVIKDPDQDKNTQFSQILSLGVVYSLSRE